VLPHPSSSCSRFLGCATTRFAARAANRSYSSAIFSVAAWATGSSSCAAKSCASWARRCQCAELFKRRSMPLSRITNSLPWPPDTAGVHHQPARHNIPDFPIRYACAPDRCRNCHWLPAVRAGEIGDLGHLFLGHLFWPFLMYRCAERAGNEKYQRNCTIHALPWAAVRRWRGIPARLSPGRRASVRSAETKRGCQLGAASGLHQTSLVSILTCNASNCRRCRKVATALPQRAWPRSPPAPQAPGGRGLFLRFNRGIFGERGSPSYENFLDLLQMGSCAPAAPSSFPTIN
jgi:hypothetical protein